MAVEDAKQISRAMVSLSSGPSPDFSRYRANWRAVRQIQNDNSQEPPRLGMNKGSLPRQNHIHVCFSELSRIRPRVSFKKLAAKTAL
jgi:hypothetical protein